MADKNQEKKCGHSSCACTVTGNNKYCSEYCKEAHKAGVTEIGCGCEHAACR